MTFSISRCPVIKYFSLSYYRELTARRCEYWETALRIRNRAKSTIRNYIYTISIYEDTEDVPKPYDWDKLVGILEYARLAARRANKMVDVWISIYLFLQMLRIVFYCIIIIALIWAVSEFLFAMTFSEIIIPTIKTVLLGGGCIIVTMLIMLLRTVLWNLEIILKEKKDAKE